MVDIDVNDHHFTLANIHGPNRDDPDFFSFVLDKIHSSSQADLLFGGDFNIILDDELIDKHGGSAHRNPKARKIILHTCIDLNLIDIYRRFHPRKKIYYIPQKSLHLNPNRFFWSLRPSHFGRNGVKSAQVLNQIIDLLI